MLVNFIDSYAKDTYSPQISYMHEDCVDNEIVFILGYMKRTNKDAAKKYLKISASRRKG